MWKFILLLITEYYKWYYAPINRLYYEPMNIILNKIPHETHVYAIDFDNTIAFTNYPKIIKPIPYALKVLKVLSDDPYSILILWTCREKEDLQDALKFLNRYKIKFDYINENCKLNLALYKNDCRKVSADIYIDDHSYEGIEGIKKLWKDWWFWMKENKIA